VPSAGPVVPDVVGMNATAAENALKAAGLEFVVVFQRTGPPNPPPLGTVISEKPSAGTHVPNGTKVTIVVYREI
jgi:beta-lactam-binding protein with PASTA domain